ncbi:hypothetical protein EOM89_10825 [Candidatus Falkowbacteria bacterium]|nr:hypothetical protein [Candidatus Falkowbacteria bacterium]
MIRAALLGLLLLLAPAVRAEELVAGLSQDNIGITARFDGSEILIYGAVKRDAPIPFGPPLHVIVTIEGPSAPVTIRRKSREAGIWINTDSVAVASAPSFYAVATTGGLANILSTEEDERQRISLPLAMRSFAGPLRVDDTRPFTEALLRIRKAQGLYTVNERGVRLVEGTLFRADFTLPANLVEGDYKARIFLTRAGKVIDMHQAAIQVRKVGLERWVFALSRENPVLYGLLSLALAVAAGWAASAAFRMIRS